MTKKILIEFPCYFSIKIIGKNTEEFVEKIMDISLNHFSNFTRDNLKQKISKNSNYLAITLDVFTINQSQLDKFYNALSQISGVKMIL